MKGSKVDDQEVERKKGMKVEDQEVESQKGKWRIKKQKARKESEGSRSKSGSILFERKVIYSRFQ